MGAPPVQYVLTSDGYEIAYCVSGEGRPLVFDGAAFSNVRVLWKRYGHWMEGLAKRFKLIAYDPRGWGLSTRGLSQELTLEDFAKDLPAVIDGLQLPRVVLYAFGGHGHDAVRYARAHPERVEALIWNAAHVTFQAFPQAQFAQLSRENWPLFLSTLAPRGLPRDEYDDWLSDTRESVTFEDFTRVLVPIHYLPSAVELELRHLAVPLLVLHPRDYPSLAQEESMRVAALTPGAKFVLIDSDRHNVYGSLHGDPVQGLAAIDAFLKSIPPITATPPVTGPSLSQREIDVLRLLAAGRSNSQIADELVISASTVAKHVSNILGKTKSHNRAEATSYAHRHGLL